nr:hypothetical protein [Tanacetum cinerariifolium]
MSPDLQRALENYKAYDMIQELKTMFKEQANQELFEKVKAFHACKHEDGQPISANILKIKGYLDTLERLGYAMPKELGTIAELHAMLKLHKKGIPKKAETPAILAVWEGHWKRNCLSYQAELKKRKNASIASTSGIFTIELYAFPNKNWVYDTGCGNHICNTSQSLKGTKKLKHRALSLSARIPKAPDRYGFYVDVEKYELGDLNEPPNYKAALSYSESDNWLETMNIEIQSIKDNRVWVLVELPPNGRTVRSKLLFKKKTDMDGKVHTFKACLAAKGYTQTHDVDYEETFSHVADFRAIRILLAISMFYDYEIWQMDVKTFFLNDHLSEDQNPGKIHWTPVKTILKYLRNTKDMVLMYGEKPEAELKVSCYADAKAEYIVAAEASMEAVWMRKFIDVLGDDVPSNKRPIEMLCDNEHAIAIANDPRILKGARHLGDLRKFSDIGAWYAIENMPNMIKKCSNPTSAIFDETIAHPNAQIVGDEMVRVQVPRSIAWSDYDKHVDSLSTIDNEVGVISPESTTQTLPSFKEYISPVTYPKEVEKTLGTPIEVERLNEIKLKEVA